MLTSLLPYKCTISRPTTTTTSGEQTQSFSTIYTNAACRYYGARASKLLQDTQSAQQTLTNYFNVILPPDKTNIQRGDKITFPDMPARNFIVEDANFKRLNGSTLGTHMFLLIRQE